MPNDAAQYTQINEVWHPLQVGAQYNLPIAGLSGEGQHVAIMALGNPPPQGVLQNLIKAATKNLYSGTFKVDQLPSDPRQPNWSPVQQTGEYAMDAQIIACFCPKADITIFVGGGSLRGMADVINAAVDAGCKVLTSSVGFPESILGKYSNTSEAEVNDIQAALENARKNNMTVFVASGDSGSGERIGNHAVVGEQDQVGVGILATQPLLVCCGGTEIRKENGTPVETTWNNSNLHLDSAFGAAGAGTGGVSMHQPLPAWQSDYASITQANTGKTGRIVPDVAGAASFVDWDIWEASLQLGQQTVQYEWRGGASPSGGTSAVAPSYAAVFTLINQKRAGMGKDGVGWINEWMYANAPTNGMFNDITQGDCTPKAKPKQYGNPNDPRYVQLATFELVDNGSGYAAGSGFDACTGWGAPNGSKFFDALVAK